MKDKVRRTKVVDVLRRTDYGSIVSVKGWVRTHRSSKSVDFIALNDEKEVEVTVPSDLSDTMADGTKVSLRILPDKVNIFNRDNHTSLIREGV